MQPQECRVYCIHPITNRELSHTLEEAHFHHLHFHSCRACEHRPGYCCTLTKNPQLHFHTHLSLCNRTVQHSKQIRPSISHSPKCDTSTPPLAEDVLNSISHFCKHKITKHSKWKWTEMSNSSLGALWQNALIILIKPFPGQHLQGGLRGDDPAITLTAFVHIALAEAKQAGITCIIPGLDMEVKIPHSIVCLTVGVIEIILNPWSTHPRCIERHAYDSTVSDTCTG